MHTLSGWWTPPRGNLSQQTKNQGMWTFPNLKPGVVKKSHCLQKDYGETQSIQYIRPPKRSKSWKDRMSHNLHVSPATVHHTILDRQGDVRMRTWRPHGWFGREYCYLGHISEWHSSSSSWTRLWGEFTIHKESSLEKWGTVIQWQCKTDRWTIRNHWCKHNFQKSKILRGCRQAYYVNRLIRSSTSQPTSSPTLCSVWENGRWSYCDLEEQN